MTFSVAVAGASGNVGGELLRLIAKHPQLQLKTVTASSMVGEKVSSLHPGVAKFADMVFSPNDAQSLSGHDIVFLALPHSNRLRWLLGFRQRRWFSIVPTTLGSKASQTGKSFTGETTPAAGPTACQNF